MVPAAVEAPTVTDTPPAKPDIFDELAEDTTYTSTQDNKEPAGDLQAAGIASAQQDNPWLVQIITYLEKSILPDDAQATQ
jgi:hypothetical protein